MSDSLQLHPKDCSLPGSSIHRIIMGLSQQEYWSGCHFHLKGIFPTQGSKPHLWQFLNWQAEFFTTEPPWKPPRKTIHKFDQNAKEERHSAKYCGSLGLTEEVMSKLGSWRNRSLEGTLLPGRGVSTCQGLAVGKGILHEESWKQFNTGWSTECVWTWQDLLLRSKQNPDQENF